MIPLSINIPACQAPYKFNEGELCYAALQRTGLIMKID